MPRSSRSSAGAIYLDEPRRLEELRQAADRAVVRMPTITRIVLFGSVVTGQATPSSDADLLVVVGTTPHARARDRVPEVLAALAPLPCPVDLFVLTADELEGARHEGAPLIREALGTGVDLVRVADG